MWLAGSTAAIQSETMLGNYSSTNLWTCMLHWVLFAIFSFFQPYEYSLNILTSSNGNIFRANGSLWEESTGDRWIFLTKATDAKLLCFLLSAPEQMIEQSRRRWFETPSRSLWRHCNEAWQFKGYFYKITTPFKGIDDVASFELFIWERFHV